MFNSLSKKRRTRFETIRIVLLIHFRSFPTSKRLVYTHYTWTDSVFKISYDDDPSIPTYIGGPSETGVV